MPSVPIRSRSTGVPYRIRNPSVQRRSRNHPAPREARTRAGRKARDPRASTASPPGGGIDYPSGNGSVEPPQQAGQPTEHGTDVGPHIDYGEGYGSTTPTKGPEEKSPIYEGPPNGGPTSTGTEQRPGHRPPAWTPVVNETVSGSRPEVEPSHQAAVAADGTYGPRSVVGRRAGHVGFEDSLSVHPPDGRDDESPRAVDALRGWDGGPATPAVPLSDRQRLVGDQAQSASPLVSVTLPWATSFSLNPVWDDGGFLVQQAQEVIHSLQGGARAASAGTHHGGSLSTQRGPPLQIPSPFSGFGIVLGATAAGSASSSDGSEPLLAVLFSCLFILPAKDRSRVYRAFHRPGTVPRLALERPG